MKKFEQDLFIASEKNLIETVKSCVEILGNINCTNIYRESALNIAVANKHEEIVRFLLEQKNIDLHNQSYLAGTPLTFAIFSNQTKIAKLLLAKEDKFINQQHPGALSWAILNNDTDIIEQLKNKGADFNSPGLAGYLEPPDWTLKPEPDPRATPFNRDVQLYLNYTPLCLAIFNQDLTLLDYLLTKGEANPNTPNYDGKLPLQVAVERNNKEIVELLLTYGANPELPKQDKANQDLPHFLRRRTPRISSEIQQLLEVQKAKNEPELAKALITNEELVSKLNAKQLVEIVTASYNHSEIAELVISNSMLLKKLETEHLFAIARCTDLNLRVVKFIVENTNLLSRLSGEQLTEIATASIYRGLIAKSIIIDNNLAEKLDSENVFKIALSYEEVAEVIFTQIPKLANKLTEQQLTEIACRSIKAAAALFNNSVLVEKLEKKQLIIIGKSMSKNSKLLSAKLEQEQFRESIFHNFPSPYALSSSSLLSSPIYSSYALSSSSLLSSPIYSRSKNSKLLSTKLEQEQFGKSIFHNFPSPYALSSSSLFSSPIYSSYSSLLSSPIYSRSKNSKLLSTKLEQEQFRYVPSAIL